MSCWDYEHHSQTFEKTIKENVKSLQKKEVSYEASVSSTTRSEVHSAMNGQTILYRKTYNIRRTLVGNKIADHSDVVGASPVGAALITSSFST